MLVLNRTMLAISIMVAHRYYPSDCGPSEACTKLQLRGCCNITYLVEEQVRTVS